MHVCLAIGEVLGCDNIFHFLHCIWIVLTTGVNIPGSGRVGLLESAPAPNSFVSVRDR